MARSCVFFVDVWPFWQIHVFVCSHFGKSIVFKAIEWQSHQWNLCCAEAIFNHKLVQEKQRPRLQPWRWRPWRPAGIPWPRRSRRPWRPPRRLWIPWRPWRWWRAKPWRPWRSRWPSQWACSTIWRCFAPRLVASPVFWPPALRRSQAGRPSWPGCWWVGKNGIGQPWTARWPTARDTLPTRSQKMGNHSSMTKPHGFANTMKMPTGTSARNFTHGIQVAFIHTFLFQVPFQRVVSFLYLPPCSQVLWWEEPTVHDGRLIERKKPSKEDPRVPDWNKL